MQHSYILVILILLPILFADYASYMNQSAFVFPVINGWYKDRHVYYYNFFTNSPKSGGIVQTAPLYSLVTGFMNGNVSLPIPVAGQHNIANVLPGDSAYSDLWQIIFVTVPNTYVANNITDVTTLLATYSNTTIGPKVNCPVVPLNSSLNSTGPSITYGWYQNQTIHYFDFGPSVSYTIPIYVLPNVTGQYNIIDFVPGDPGYSAFWDATLFTAPNGYVSNTYKSQAEVTAASLASVAGPQAINCPVFKVDPPSTSTSSSTSTSTSASTSSSQNTSPTPTSGNSAQLTVGTLLMMVLIYII